MSIWKLGTSLLSFSLQLTRACLIAVVWEGIQLPLKLNQAQHTHTKSLLISSTISSPFFFSLICILLAPSSSPSCLCCWGVRIKLLLSSSSSLVCHIPACDAFSSKLVTNLTPAPCLVSNNASSSSLFFTSSPFQSFFLNSLSLFLIFLTHSSDFLSLASFFLSCHHL